MTRALPLLPLLLAAACGPTGAAAPGASPDYFKAWTNGPPSDPSWFPISVWLQSPDNAARYQECGIDLFIGLWQGPTKDQLDALAEVGMKVICDQNPVGLAYPAGTIIGWMHQDEPDNAQPIMENGQRTGWGGPVPPGEVIARYQRMKAADPTRPIYLNLGQGVANDQWIGRGTGSSPDDYLGYVQGADILSYDVYPVAGISKPDGENYLWYLGKGLDRLAQWCGGTKRLWNVVETTNIGAERGPTPEQVRSEVWISLIHGAKGITYFCHRFAPTFKEAGWLDDAPLRDAITTLNQQVHELAPVLNSPASEQSVKVTSSDAEVPVDVLRKDVDGVTWLFAVGMRNGATKASFELAGLAGDRTATVIGEGRTVALHDGRFDDSFGPYQVHLYRIE